MALTDVRKSVLGVVNEVERLMGLTTSATLDERRMTLVYLRLLNDVVADLNDFGDWRELYNETVVSAVASAATFTVAPSAKMVHHLHEVRFSSQPAAMSEVDMSDMRRMQRMNSSGVPRQWAFRSVDASANPVLAVWPVPAETSGYFDVSYYEKVREYTTADADVVPPFATEALVAGLYARALFEEQSGEPSRQALTAGAEYEKRKRESYNRYNADSGTSFQMRPSRWGRR